MRFYDLFAGIGGFHLAFERAGHECVGGCEINEYARQIYREHFPETPLWEDAREIIPLKLPNFDCLTAGFPCQAFSIAGRRLGFEESRGTLFFEIARIIRQKRPKLLLLENVKGLLSHDGGKTFAVILSTLDECGYDAEWQVLNSKYFVPQNRERIFLIGHLRGESRSQVFPLGEVDKVYDGTRKEAQRKGSRLRSKYTGAIDANYSKGGGSRTMIKMIQDAKHSTNRLYSTDGIARTIRASSGGLGAKTGVYAVASRNLNRNGPITKEEGTFALTRSVDNNVYDGKSYRQLTPLECERLQGFPDNWTKKLSNAQRYKCLGNAVTVPVVEYILKCL